MEPPGFEVLVVLTFTLAEALTLAAVCVGIGGIVWRLGNVERRLSRIEARLEE